MSGGRDGVPAVTSRQRIYPMSREQEALWLDDLVRDGQSVHLESWASKLTGKLDTGAIEWAVSQVIARHEVLRTRLTERDGEPVQIVTPPGAVTMEHLSCPQAELHAELSRIAVAPLDLNEAPCRPWLVSLSPDESVLVVQFHHAIIDDWSLDIFQRELMHFYTARVRGRPPGLEPLPMQAGDFAVAQRAAGLDPTSIEYWRHRVQAVPRSCTIPPDRLGSQMESHRGGRHLFGLSPDLGQAVRATSRALRTTPFTVFAGVMAALLWQYGDHDEVIFGTPVSLRGHAAVDSMIGCLTNLHPLRLAVSSDMSFRTLASAAKAEVLGAMEHRAVPYSQIARMARRAMDADAPQQLCDAAMVVDDMRWAPFVLPDITVEPIRLPPGHVKFAVHLGLVACDEGGYAGSWSYDAEVFNAATVARVASQFTKLLTHCIAAPDDPIGQIPGP